MRKSFLKFIGLILIFGSGNAQIRKPEVSANINKERINRTSQGLKVELKSISLNDINKLKIPVVRVAEEILNKKPINSWSINPKKHFNAQLKVNQLFGYWNENVWGLYSDIWADGLNI